MKLNAIAWSKYTGFNHKIFEGEIPEAVTVSQDGSTLFMVKTRKLEMTGNFQLYLELTKAETSRLNEMSLIGKLNDRISELERTIAALKPVK